MRRLLAILLLLAVTVPAAWVLLGGSLPDALGSAGPPAATGSQDGRFADGTGQRDPGTADANAGALRAVAEPSPGRLPPLERDQVRIRVVDAATRAPVPFAEIVAEPAGAPSRRYATLSPADRRLLHRLNDHFDKLARFGQSATADADGRAVLRVGRMHDVAARLGGRYGAIMIEAPGSGEVELPIEPDVALTVRVVDGGGQPLADVPVGLAVVVAREGAAAGDGQSWLVGYTDPSGEVVIRHLQRLPHEWPRYRLRDLTAFVHAPGLTSVHAPAVPSSEPVLLRVEAHGSVLIELRDRDGRPPGDEFVVEGVLATDDEQPATNHWDNVDLRELSAGGAVLFPYVGLGRTIGVGASFGDHALAERCPGPRQHRETTVVRLSVSPTETAELRGRLVDPSGAAMGFTVADLQLVDLHLLGSVETDADGRFRWFGRADLVPAGASLCIAALSDYVPTGASARIPLPATAVRDLGDVVVHGGRTIARGIVVADTPALPECTLSVIEIDAAGEADRSARHAVDLRPDGSFAVLEFWPETARRQQLRVDAELCLPVRPCDFVAGQENLRIELRQGSRLSVRVLVDEAFADRSGGLRARLAGGGRVFEIDGESRDGAWLLEQHGLEAGTYRLEVQLHERQVAVLDPLPLQPGHAGDSAPPVDLRGRLANMRLRAVGADGEVLDLSGQIRMRDPGGAWLQDEQSIWLEHGLAQWLVPAGPVELAVEIWETRSLSWSGLAGSVDLRVDPPVPAQVAIAGMPALPEGVPYLVWVAAAPAWLEQRRLPDWYVALGDDGDAELRDGVVHFMLSEAEDLLLRISGGEPERLLAELPFRVTAKQPHATVTLPPEVAEQLRQLPARRR